MRVQLPERLSKAMDLDHLEKLLSDIESSRDRAMIVVPMSRNADRSRPIQGVRHSYREGRAEFTKLQKTVREESFAR